MELNQEDLKFVVSTALVLSGDAESENTYERIKPSLAKLISRYNKKYPENSKTTNNPQNGVNFTKANVSGSGKNPYTPEIINASTMQILSTKGILHNNNNATMSQIINYVKRKAPSPMNTKSINPRSIGGALAGLSRKCAKHGLPKCYGHNNTETLRDRCYYITKDALSVFKNL